MVSSYTFPSQADHLLATISLKLIQNPNLHNSTPLTPPTSPTQTPNFFKTQNTPRDISMILHSLAKINYRDHRVFDTLGTSLIPLIPSGTVKSLQYSPQ